MGYTILLKPYFLICFGSGLGMGVLALLLGSAPFVAPLLLGLNSSFYLGLGLLGTVVVLSLFSKLREHIDWKEIFRLGPFFFVGAGAAFYYSFQFYFRYSGLFLFVSAVAWLFSVPFLPRHTTNRQFLFFPFLSNVLQGFLGGLVVGGLGLAGLPLVTPFLQIFRKMDRSAATSTSVPLSALSLIPMVLVLSLHPASQTPLQPNNQMFLLVGLLFESHQEKHLIIG
ncbi:MAG: hypothetical protein EBZ49_18745, partial [Proteobacteria bacterium]|nr:hypothetical protein [Pseudomonadota bacterium]